MMYVYLLIRMMYAFNYIILVSVSVKLAYPYV